MKASDGDAASAWKPSADDKEPWWQLDMEFEFRLDRVEAKAAGNWKGQPPRGAGQQGRQHLEGRQNRSEQGWDGADRSVSGGRRS